MPAYADCALRRTATTATPTAATCGELVGVDSRVFARVARLHASPKTGGFVVVAPRQPRTHVLSAPVAMARGRATRSGDQAACALVDCGSDDGNTKNGDGCDDECGVEVLPVSKEW